MRSPRRSSCSEPRRGSRCSSVAAPGGSCSSAREGSAPLSPLPASPRRSASLPPRTSGFGSDVEQRPSLGGAGGTPSLLLRGGFVGLRSRRLHEEHGQGGKKEQDRRLQAHEA